MLPSAKRPLLLLATASVSASAGFMYLGDDGKAALPAPPTAASASLRGRKLARKTRSRAVKATSKQELGLQQSLVRDLACWISSASVYAARQAFITSSAPKVTAVLKPEALETVAPSLKGSQVYHNLFGWLQEIAPEDADQVLQSSSFSMLLNLISDAENNLAACSAACTLLTPESPRR